MGERQIDLKRERNTETKTDRESVFSACAVPQANNMEFEILAGVVIEHGSLITWLPGWPAITMTYHRTEEHRVYNKILRHDKHCPEETNTTHSVHSPKPGHPVLDMEDSSKTVTPVDEHLRIQEVHILYFIRWDSKCCAH